MTYSKIELARIFIGAPMALHVRSCWPTTILWVYHHFWLDGNRFCAPYVNFRVSDNISVILSQQTKHVQDCHGKFSISTPLISAKNIFNIAKIWESMVVLQKRRQNKDEQDDLLRHPPPAHCKHNSAWCLPCYKHAILSWPTCYTTCVALTCAASLCNVLLLQVLQCGRGVSLCSWQWGVAPYFSQERGKRRK